MTKKYHYQNKQLTVKELVNLSNNINYDTMTNRLRKGWSVDDAIKTPLHNRPGKAAKIDLLSCIPRASCFNNIDLNKQDKIIIVGLIDDYLSSKEKGLKLLSHD